MIGADQAMEALYQTVKAIPAVTAAIGARLYPNEAPPATVAPFGRFYFSGGEAAQPVGVGVSAERLVFTIEFIDRGPSTAKIRAAAKATQVALHAMRYVTADQYSVAGRYVRSTSFPLPTEQGNTYVRLAGDFEMFVSYPS